jgi:replicative DNA helicase
MTSTLNTLDKYYRLRKLYYISTDIHKRLEEDKVDVEDTIDATADKLASIRLKSDLTQQLYHIGRSNNTTNLVKSILDKSRKNFVPTGFKSFDSRNGGFFDGSLVVLGGSTGAGKSSVAIALLINMTRLAGENCCYVPLEMTEEESMTRILANVSGVPLTKINQKKLSKAETKKVIGGYKAFSGDLKKHDCRYTIFSPEEDLGIEEILLLLKPYGYRVIIIDYISLLKGVDGDDSWQQLGKVARFCKVWAKNNNCIVILLAQVSEEGKIRYARAVGEHASNAWTWVATDETRESGLLQIRQFKARNQQMFSFDLRFDAELMRVYDVDDKELSSGASSDAYISDVSEEEEEE